MQDVMLYKNQYIKVINNGIKIYIKVCELYVNFCTKTIAKYVDYCYDKWVKNTIEKLWLKYRKWIREKAKW